MKKKILPAAAVVALVIQFLPAPAKTNPPSDPARSFAAVMHPPQAVLQLLEKACYDCHSHATRWPWYADIAPMSWPVRKHVTDGRKQLNFSEWLQPGETQFSDWNGLESVCTTVRQKEMPLPGYDWMHAEAKLTDIDRQTICTWVDGALAKAR